MEDAVTAPDRVALLRRMLLIRRFEEAWGEAYLQEEIGGIPPALSTGQEAVSVGACAALAPGDTVFTTHRGQAPQLALGLDPKRVMAELYCRRTGYNKGKSYHVTSVEHGVIGMGGIVGAQIPVAAGAAFAHRAKGTGGVSLVFFGDGAVGEGAFHETANLAALWSLPLVLVCENNLYCISLPVAEHVAGGAIAERARGYGMPGREVDGDDPVAVYEAVAHAVAAAREGRGPTLVEARTHRLSGHLVHDPQRYRSEEEIRREREACPIACLRKKLRDEGGLSESGWQEIEAEVEGIVAEALRFARESPYPEPSEAFEDLWA